MVTGQQLAESLDILTRAFDLVFTSSTRDRVFEIQNVEDINDSQKHSLSRGSSVTYLLKLAQYMESALSSLVSCITLYLQNPNEDDKVILVWNTLK